MPLNTRIIRIFFKLSLVVFLCFYAFLSHCFSQDDITKKAFDPSKISDIKEAIDYLRKLNLDNPADSGIREQLAKAYNYYAIQLASSGNLDAAIDYLGEAYGLSGSNVEYRNNFSMLYTRRGHNSYLLKNMDRAYSDLKNAVRISPDNVLALTGLGNIYYSQGRLSEAKDCWERAARIEPQNKEVTARLDSLKHEILESGSFKTRETQNFIFMFDEKLDEFQFGNIENILNEVYVKVGQDFNYFPSYKVTVQIYSLGKYKSQVQSAEGVAGVYDGKIKLPVYSGSDRDSYRRVVYHEYTHALIFDLSADRCPLWLNEGLAAYEDPGFIEDATMLFGLYKSDRLPNPADLSQYFLDLNNRINLAIAYNEAHALVKYFLTKFNFWYMKNILTDLKAGMDIDMAFRKEISFDTVSFFKTWKEECQIFLH